MDLQERIAWREFTQNPCPETAFRWARLHSRTMGEPADIPITEIDGLGNREKKLLIGAGIDTFEKLTQVYRNQLGAIDGCGPAYRNKIIGFLGAIGIKLNARPKTKEEWDELSKKIPAFLHNAYDDSFVRYLKNSGRWTPRMTW